ncbi:17882_t:CDS:10, partial [Gigaspora rosea]
MAFNQHQLIPRPDIKVGFRLNDEYADTLLPRIRKLLRSEPNSKRFPGTQPVDFELCHFDLLESEEYFVRDKTDGKRYIMFFTAKDGGTVFMKCLRYLIFDLMVLNGSVLIERPYNKRMGMLKQDVIEPLNAALKRNPELEKRMPFTMEIKSMELSYGLINTLQKIPSLKYGNDGLIFVPVNRPYEPDICHELLLWKPTNQMFVNFKIKIIKPSRDKKPIYQLLIASDENTHKFHDYFTPDPQTEVDWIKNVHEGDIGQFWYDEHWSTTIYDADPHIRHGGWRFRRFKREQHTADSENVLEEVLSRIQNAVPRDELEERVTVIREKWKLRQSNRVSGSQPLLTLTQTSLTQTSLTQTSLTQASSSESLHLPPQDSHQHSTQHYDVHEDNESPREHQDSSYSSHDPQLYSSSLEKKSPVIENRSLNENKEILSSPPLLHDRHREPLQRQPLTDTNEHNERRNSYENREFIEKKDSIVENLDSSIQSNELFKTPTPLHDCHREPLQRLPLTHNISIKERRNSYEDIDLHDEEMDSDVTENSAQSLSPQTHKMSISNTESQIPKLEPTSPSNKQESFSGSENLVEDIDPDADDADPWDAPDYYESSQIINNELSYPEDQSEYWEENDHIESSESSEAALDNNFLTDSVKQEADQREEIQELEIPITHDQFQTRKPQQYRRESQPSIISQHQDSRYITQQGQSQMQKPQQHQLSIRENSSIISSRPTIQHEQPQIPSLSIAQQIQGPVLSVQESQTSQLLIQQSPPLAQKNQEQKLAQENSQQRPQQHRLSTRESQFITQRNVESQLPIRESQHLIQSRLQEYQITQEIQRQEPRHISHNNQTSIQSRDLTNAEQRNQISQVQRAQELRHSVQEIRPSILQRQSEAHVHMQHLRPQLRIPETLQENRPHIQRSQSLSHEHLIYSQQPSSSQRFPIQQTQYPIQEIQRTSNRQLQEFQERGQFSERTEWEPNTGIEIPEINNNNVLPHRPIHRRHTFTSNDITQGSNIPNTRQFLNPYSSQLSTSPIDITSQGLSTQSQTIPGTGITPILKHEELSILNESPNHQFINYTQISSTSSRPAPQKRKSK